jgi:non-specific serine/threonine protein kinase
VQDPGQVPVVVAVLLGVREEPGVPIAATLAQVLARQQLLLVLDNCEHVLGAAAGLCAELVAACDDLRVLATSREALRVTGEARYRLGPLAVPDPDDLADAARAEAVVLFVDRARGPTGASPWMITPGQSRRPKEDDQLADPLSSVVRSSIACRPV